MKSQKADHNNYKLALVMKAPEVSQVASQRFELPLFPSQSLTLADHTDPTSHHNARTISSKPRPGLASYCVVVPQLSFMQLQYHFHMILYSTWLSVLCRSSWSLPSLSIQECIPPGFAARRRRVVGNVHTSDKSKVRADWSGSEAKLQIPEILPFCY